MARRPVLLERHLPALAAAAALGLLALALFVLMAFDGPADWIGRFDERVRHIARSAQWRPLVWVARFLGFVGSWYVTWPLRFAVTAFLVAKRRWEALSAWVLAIALYEPLVGLLKGVYERPRPPLAEGVTGYSFPSGHAVVGAAIAIGLVVVLVPAGPTRRILEVAAGGFAFTMAISRVYLDVHWFTDVVAGTALGAAIMLGVASLVHRVGGRVAVGGGRGDP